MKIFSQLLLTTLLLSINNLVFSGDYSLGVKTGTLGIGVELARPIKKSLNLRLGLNRIQGHVSNFKMGSIEYDVDANATSINALLDWYPKNNKKFYFSGGFLLGNDHINPTPSPDFIFHGIKIGQALSRYKVDLKVDYNDIAPYFSIGYSNKATKNKKWHYAVDAGFAYLGKANASFNIIDKTTGKTPLGISQAAINRELTRINKKLDDYKVWPVLSLTWSYQF